MNDTTTKSVSLNLDCPPVAKAPFLLTQGIPFRDGEYPDGAGCRVLDENGTEYPTQSRPLATWHRDGRFVKWLLIDVLLSAKASKGDRLRLEYGPDVRVALPEQPLSYDFYDEEHTRPKSIYNDSFRVEFVDTKKPGNGEFLRTLRIRSGNEWKDLPGDAAFPKLYASDANDVTYVSSASRPPAVTMEDRGPVRCSVCVKGVHTDGNGVSVLPYTLRIHFFSTGDRIRLFHTFVFDQNPDQFKISDLGLLLPFDLGSLTGTSVASDNNESHRLGPAVSVLQADDRSYRIESDSPTDSSTIEGSRFGGWVHASGTESSAAVILRDMWREYPKGIRINERGEIAVELWPKRINRLLDLEVPWKEEFIHCSRVAKTEEELLEQMAKRPTAPVNFKGFFGTSSCPRSAKEGDLQSVQEARAFAENRLGGRRFVLGDVHATGTAVGLAKTHEMWIVFGGALDAELVDEIAKTVQTPPLALPEPKNIVETDVLRIVHPYSEDKFPELERSMDLLFDAICDGPVEADRLYGMLDYGDLLNAHGRAHGFTYRVFRDYPGKRITDLIGWFNNECFDHLYNEWVNYLRTGRRKCWRLAEAYSEHLEDVDTIHHDVVHPDHVGLTHYHNIMHWSGGPSPSHTQIQGWLLHYFLTGNRRAFEVAKEVADHFVTYQEPAGLISNRSIALRREFVGPMATLWFFYQATWEQRYLDCAERTLEAFWSTRTKNGLFPRDIFTAGRLGGELTTSGDDSGLAVGFHDMCMMYDRYRDTKDPKIREIVLQSADALVAEYEAFEPDELAELRGDTYLVRIRSFPLVLAFAYQLTRDEKYIEPLREYVEQVPEMARSWAKFDKHVPIMSAAHTLLDAAIAMAAVDMHANDSTEVRK